MSAEIKEINGKVTMPKSYFIWLIAIVLGINGGAKLMPDSLIGGDKVTVHNYQLDTMRINTETREVRKEGFKRLESVEKKLEDIEIKINKIMNKLKIEQ